jgi:hypothetical protein
MQPLHRAERLAGREPRALPAMAVAGVEVLSESNSSLTRGSCSVPQSNSARSPYARGAQTIEGRTAFVTAEASPHRATISLLSRAYAGERASQL